MIQLQFILSQIRKEAFEKPMTFDESVEISELKTLDTDIREAKKAQVFGTCALDGDEIIFSFNIVGKVVLPCARTLVDVPYDFHIKATEIFSTSEYYGKEEEEEDIHFLEGEVIDLHPLILENILLELPYRVFTDDEEALKNATLKGEGWSFTDEEELDKTEDKIDPRMKKLQQLLKDDDEN